MTDGQNNAGKIAPLTAAEAAQALGVKVYTIGVGTRGMAPCPRRSIGRPKSAIRMLPVDIDEDTLQKIADKTGGKYYRADNAEKFRSDLRRNRPAGKDRGGGEEIRSSTGTVPLVSARPWLLLLLEWCSAATRLLRTIAMTFAHPNLLWLLAAGAAGLIGFFWWAARKRQQLDHPVRPGPPAARPASRRLARAAATALRLPAAGGRPASSWPSPGPSGASPGKKPRQRGLDIVVAIDTSKSMLAADIAPNRLARAKLAALDLMQLAKSDRLGLVAFAGTAFLQCPLTIDDAAFRQSVESLDVDIIPQGGTALAEAIQTALTAFKERRQLQSARAVHRRRGPRLRRPSKPPRQAAKAGLRNLHHRRRHARG